MVCYKIPRELHTKKQSKDGAVAQWLRASNMSNIFRQLC